MVTFVLLTAGLQAGSARAEQRTVAATAKVVRCMTGTLRGEGAVFKVHGAGRAESSCCMNTI
jgi:hypothetical protein